MLDGSGIPTTSMYRAVCQNGLMGWADTFSELPKYQSWLKQPSQGKEKKTSSKQSREHKKRFSQTKIHHSRQTPELFQEQLYQLLVKSTTVRP